MINGFEEDPKPLSEDEIKLVPIFVVGLSGKIGKANAITNAEIKRSLEEKGIKVGDITRIEEIINYIRMQGLVKNIIASSNGYWIENDPVTIARYKASLLQKATTILTLWKTY